MFDIVRPVSEVYTKDRRRSRKIKIKIKIKIAFVTSSGGYWYQYSRVLTLVNRASLRYGGNARYY